MFAGPFYHPGNDSSNNCMVERKWTGISEWYVPERFRERISLSTVLVVPELNTLFNTALTKDMDLRLLRKLLRKFLLNYLSFT